MLLTGWGRYPVLEAKVSAPRSVDALREHMGSGQEVIARGNGRAYGDSAINPDGTIEMRHFDRLLEFDPAAGHLVAEPGVLLGDIVAAFLPRGWFLQISPGTQFVTLGGAIAADVHGKNHHKDGSFRNCVDWIDVMDATGAVTRCSQQENADLFDHTVGGMGLTGIITRCAIRLRQVETGWIRQTTHPADNLEAAMALIEGNLNATYSVAWIDGQARGDDIGRSVVFLAEHAELNDLPEDRRAMPFDVPARATRKVPFDLPSFTLNKYSVRAFNALYYRAGVRHAGARLVDWERYFYPLDAILDWNRLYGRKGFVQFQCVLPLDASKAGLLALLGTLANAGMGSFLAVMKRLGAQDSAFSFPMEGYTLALDFPVNDRTLRLMNTLDRITLEHGGRFYLAKDARMAPETFAASDGRIAAFRDKREGCNWQKTFVSAQSKRLGI